MLTWPDKGGTTACEFTDDSFIIKKFVLVKKIPLCKVLKK